MLDFYLINLKFRVIYIWTFNLDRHVALLRSFLIFIKNAGPTAFLSRPWQTFLKLYYNSNAWKTFPHAESSPLIFPWNASHPRIKNMDCFHFWNATLSYTVITNNLYGSFFVFLKRLNVSWPFLTVCTKHFLPFHRPFFSVFK